MIYFVNPSTQMIRDEIGVNPGLGIIATPKSVRDSQWVDGATWCADNGCYTDNWSSDHWWKFLDKYKDRPQCAFAVAPDIVGDHFKTLDRSREWLPRLRELGYRAAFPGGLLRR